MGKAGLKQPAHVGMASGKLLYVNTPGKRNPAILESDNHMIREYEMVPW